LPVELTPPCAIAGPDCPEIFKLARRRGGEALAAAIAQACGAAPRACEARAFGQAGRVMWRAPGAWLIIGDEAAAASAAIAAETGCAITDLSGALARWRLHGEDWRTLMTMGCPLDVESLAPGAAAATRFGKFDILLDVYGAGDAALYVAPSFAQDFDAALRAAAQRLAIP
jgi:heterotetrameric sarcosine oxidase gamma subunit